MRTMKWLAAAAAALAIAGCGGGGGGSGDTLPTGNPTGFWLGTTTNGLQLAALILPSRTAWAFYAGGGGNVGVVQGPLDGAALDFKETSQTALNSVIVAGAEPRSTIAGNISGLGGTVGFAGTYQAAFDNAPSLAAAAGAYTGSVTAGATFTLAAGGAITGGTPACTYAGNATPRADANAFDSTITIAGGACTIAGTTMTGVAVQNGANQLIAGAITAARSGAFVFIGNR